MLNYSENHEHLYTLEIYPLYNNTVLYKLYYSYSIADVLLHKKSVLKSNHLSVLTINESLAAIIGSRWRCFASSLFFTSEALGASRETRGAEPTRQALVMHFPCFISVPHYVRFSCMHSIALTYCRYSCSIQHMFVSLNFQNSCFAM